MAITRADKEAAVAQLKDDFSRFKLAVLTDYRGLSVAEVQELRHLLGAEGASFRVSKNTLVKLALTEKPELKGLDPSIFTGPMALAVGFEDEVAAARIVFQYGRTHEALEITGAITAAGELLTPAQVKQLATLPTKDQLRAQLVGTIAAPLTGFVGVLGANVRSIVNVLQAISKLEQKET